MAWFKRKVTARELMEDTLSQAASRAALALTLIAGQTPSMRGPQMEAVKQGSQAFTTLWQSITCLLVVKLKDERSGRFAQIVISECKKASPDAAGIFQKAEEIMKAIRPTSGSDIGRLATIIFTTTYPQIVVDESKVDNMAGMELISSCNYFPWVADRCKVG